MTIVILFQASGFRNLKTYYARYGQSRIAVHWEAPLRLEPIHISTHLIPINAPPAENLLEATRVRACANQCYDCTVVLSEFANSARTRRNPKTPSQRTALILHIVDAIEI